MLKNKKVGLGRSIIPLKGNYTEITHIFTVAGTKPFIHAF